MSHTHNPLICTDQELEQLEDRLRIFPDLPVDPSVAQKLLDTARRARYSLASLSRGPVCRSAVRTAALIQYGLGETCRD